MGNLLKFISGFISILAIGFQFTANALTALTTPGAVSLMSTFECISVRAAYVGDTNENNVAAIQYRRTGDVTWLLAYPPIIDRRSQVVIVGITNSNAANQFQARGSIVGLVPNTGYDVRVTWSDADGIVGNSSITNVISTVTYSPPLGGVTLHVDAAAGSEGSGSSVSPFKTITNGVQQMSVGDTLLVRPGVYVPFAISKSGNAGAYLAIKTNGAGDVSISESTTINNALTLNANFWLIDGIKFGQSKFEGLRIGAGNHHIYIQHTLQTNAVFQTNSACGATLIGSGAHDLFIQSNSWSTFNASITNTVDGLVDMIDMDGGGPTYSLVIAHNILNGGWDCIGNRFNSGFGGHGENCDFCYNSCTNWIDDLVELDGLGPNIRYFGNTARRWALGINPDTGGNYGGSLLSDCGTYIGPTYIFRNDASGDYTNSAGADGGAGFGLKIGGHSSVGWVYYFHNVFRTRSVAGAHEVVAESGGPGCPFRSMNHTFENNIFVSRGNVYYQGGATNLHDYNCCFKIGTADFASSWNCTGTSYNTFALFVAGAGQEVHGVGTDPLLDTSLHIPTNSPAVDAGLVLTNFNDSSSAWPFAGSAPDMGAFESNGVMPPVTNASLTITSTNPNSGVAITVSPVDSNGNGNGSTSFSRIFVTNIVVSLTAPSSAGTNIFSFWQKDGIDYTTNLLVTVQMDAAHVMNAAYIPTVPPPVAGGNRQRTIATTFRR